VTTPTAIICLDWREYVATLSYAQAKGLRVPQDLSLICMSDDHATDWLSPLASHFARPMDKLASTLSDWLEDITSHNNFTLKASIRSHWVEGETVAAAPRH
jgi:DNA-binding LacI/PurR family transcriptional regulator